MVAPNPALTRSYVLRVSGDAMAAEGYPHGSLLIVSTRTSVIHTETVVARNAEGVCRIAKAGELDAGWAVAGVVIYAACGTRERQ